MDVPNKCNLTLHQGLTEENNEQNEQSDYQTRPDDITQTTKNISGGNEETENQVSDSSTKTSSHDLAHQHTIPLPQTTNSISLCVHSKNKCLTDKSNDSCAASIGLDSNIPTEQLEEPSSSHDSVSTFTVSEDSAIQSERDKDANLSECHQPKCALNQESNEPSCTPIILSVRGNATDFDCFSEPSTPTNVSKSSVLPNTTSVLTRNDRPIEHTNAWSGTTNQKSTTPLPKVFKLLRSAEGVFAVPSVAPSNIDLQLSTCNSKKDSGSVSGVAKTPPVSLLQPMTPRVTKTSGNLSLQLSTQSPKTLGSTMIMTSTKRSVLASTSKTETAFSEINVRNLSVNGGKNSSTPIPSTVKIVIKQNENPSRSSSNNEKKNTDADKFDSETLCKAIVSKIFIDYEIQEKEGLTRSDVFDTKILDPCKKKREHLDRLFVCSVCGDEFYLEEFLNHHLDRKTFELFYSCLGCKKRMTFYNKCKFWLHVKGERPNVDEKSLKMETSRFKLKPYFGLHEPGTDLTCNDDLKLKCKFCHNDFLTVEQKSSHLKRNSSYLYTCNKCSMLISNKCALSAHIAIHDGDVKDHVCPQCGEDICHTGGLRSLFEHLDSCFHFNTSYVMPCECGELFGTTAAFKLHFLKSHTRALSRCHICGSCFSSTELLAVHCLRSHKISSYPCKIVLCTLCKEGFQSFWKLKGHVENHAQKIGGVRKKVLKCFLCDKYFQNPKALTSHVEKEHTHRPKRCTICFGLFESRQCLVQHIVSKSCSPDNLPMKLHVCLDTSSVPKTVDINTYKDMYILPKRIPLAKYDIATVGSKPGLFAKTLGASAKVAPVAISILPKTTSGAVSSEMTFLNVPSKSMSSTPALANVSTSKTTPSVSEKRLSTGNAVGFNITTEKIQCHSCKICLLGSAAYDKHMMLHKSLGFEIPSGYCSICKVPIDSGLIHTHMEKHQVKGTIVCSLCQRTDFKSMHEALNHSKNLCHYAVVCNDGAHYIKNKKSKTNSTYFNDNVLIREQESCSEKQSLNATPIEEKATVFPCLICGLAFTSKLEKEDHVTRFHDGIRTLYYCLVCKKKGIQKCFSVKNLLRNHISRKHRIVNPSQITKLIQKEEQNVASGQVVVSKSINHCNGDAPPPKRLRLANEGEFMCGKCGFSSEDSKRFEAHIATHNPKKEPQCPECGLCFTVLAALKKHLYVVHRIKAMDEYLENKGLLDLEEETFDDGDDSNSNEPLSDDSLAEAPKSKKRTRSSSKNTSEFECTVCHRFLPSGLALRKHMRIHGMAFIRSKRYAKT